MKAGASGIRLSSKSRRAAIVVGALCALMIATGEAVQAAPEQAPAYDKAYVGEMKTHVTAYEDTLIKIARDYAIGFNELRAANPGVDPWLPGEGVDILLPDMHILPDVPRSGIVINLPEQRLYYFKTPGDAPLSFPLGVGREGLSTPVGKTTVVRKAIGPTWRPTPRMRAEDPKLPASIGPGADNPMGTHALYLGWPAYAIHGTNKPYGVGRRVSSGCIRLYPEDIVALYDLVPEGTVVTVIDQPVKAGWIDDALYLDAHPTLAQADAVEQNGAVATYEFGAAEMATIVTAAGVHAARIDWSLVREAIRLRQGIPVVIATRPAGEDRI